MNILQKKLSGKTSSANSFDSLRSVLGGTHTEVGKYIETTLGIDIDIGAINFQPGDFKTLLLKSEGLLFALNKPNHPCHILIEIPPNLAMNCISTKLGTKANNDKTTTLFDLIVMQPMAEMLLNGLKDHDITSKECQIGGRCINFAAAPQMQTEFAPRHKWLQINLTFHQDAEGKQLGLEYIVKLYFGQSIIEQLCKLAELRSNSARIDPNEPADLTDPWVHHMRGTILETTQMLEVVLENLAMSIAECTRLELGQVIALPGASHTRLQINARSRNGVHNLATSTLGVYKANKAVKLLEDVNPDFLGGINNLDMRQI